MATTLDDEPPQSAEIDVRVAGGLAQPIDANWIMIQLRRAVDHVAASDSIPVRRLNVLIVDDERMTHLHERHGGIAETTDVLTFDLRGTADGAIEADIVVCADEAARRGKERGHPIEQELLLYCVHGLLHCAGHDDLDEAGWHAMHEREDAILKAIGVGETFARAPGEKREDQS